MKHPINSKVTVRSTIELPNGGKISTSSHDETIAKEFIGETGIVIGYNDNGMTGNTEKDPLHIVLFPNQKKESFWFEEIYAQ